MNVAGRKVKLTNLEKIYWPEGLTKAHLIKYYTDIAPVLLPYLRNRPLVLKRYPDGIDGEAFYQKECPDYAPSWIKTYPVVHTEKTINYIICNDLATLVWLANQGCIEIHAFLSTAPKIDYPDIAVLDLDPAPGGAFAQVLEVALLIRQTLAWFNLRAFVKTSGASGLHLFIPLLPRYDFKTVVPLMRYIAEAVARSCPAAATVERKVEKRKGKVYIDYLQNGRGKTIAFPYSLRPLPGAPVSTPLTWQEVEARNVLPASFNLHTIFERLKEFGDLFRDMLISIQSLDFMIEKLWRQKNL